MEYGNETNSTLNNFFYGALMVQNPVQFSYRSDAISANTRLSKSHYTDHHLYRVEWEPPSNNGTGGYVRWYVDNQFTFGIRGDNLNLTKTQIPSEPMYMIMNTAISSTWGFPYCPKTNKCCTCFECGNPKCSCGLPQGFCQNLPAHMTIDYVRVYQAFGSTTQNVGCSTADRPTKRFIEAHSMRYKTYLQQQALLPIQNGGAPCQSNSQCGKGICNAGQCVCNAGYTGPACLASDGYYNVMPPQKTLPGMLLSHIRLVIVDGC